MFGQCSSHFRFENGEIIFMLGQWRNDFYVCIMGATFFIAQV